MIREEFNWLDVCGFLKDNTSIVFLGPSIDDRSRFFFDFWKYTSCQVIQFEVSRDLKHVATSFFLKGTLLNCKRLELYTGLKYLLNDLRQDQKLRIVCIDISSLQHQILMYLTQLLIRDIKPLKLFATYTEPTKYIEKNYLGDYHLSEEFLGFQAVPGFSRRKKDIPCCLLAFLGFEGKRLIKVYEEIEKISRVIPAICFPSSRPGWQNTNLRNCMRAIIATDSITDIHKCSADSIFEAFDLIKKLQPTEEVYALAPLGTRPHSIACAIYATYHPETHIIFDHPVEAEKRSEGVMCKRCYHLTTFIMT